MTLPRSDLSHERGRGLVIKCVASIYDIYYKMVEEKIQRERRGFKTKNKNQNKNKNKYKYTLENNFQGKSRL